MRFGPCVAGILIDAIIHHQVPADITCRNTANARGGDEYLRMVLTHGLATVQCLFGRGFSVCRPDLVRCRAQDRIRKRV